MNGINYQLIVYMLVVLICSRTKQTSIELRQVTLSVCISFSSTLSTHNKH